MLGLGLGVNKQTPATEFYFSYEAEVISSSDGWEAYSVSGTSSLDYNVSHPTLGGGWMRLTIDDTQTNVVGLKYTYPQPIPAGSTIVVSYDIVFSPVTGWDPENDTDDVTWKTQSCGRLFNTEITTASFVTTVSNSLGPTNLPGNDEMLFYVSTSTPDDLPQADSKVYMKDVSIVIS
jgi:hypothetical protein